jgi:hypothetical protein
MATRIVKYLGNFNWCDRTDKDWQVSIILPNGEIISMLWAEENEPDIDGMPPSEVVELMKKRSDELWIYTGRDELNRKAAWVAEHAAEIDRDWALSQIDGLTKRIEHMSAEIEILRKSYVCQEEEV